MNVVSSGQREPGSKISTRLDGLTIAERGIIMSAVEALAVAPAGGFIVWGVDRVCVAVTEGPIDWDVLGRRVHDAVPVPEVEVEAVWRGRAAFALLPARNSLAGHGSLWLPLRGRGEGCGALVLLWDARPLLGRTSDLVAGVVDAAREPLQAIEIAARGLARSGAVDTEQRAIAMGRCAARASSLLEELVVCVRGASGRGVCLRRRPCDFGAVVRETCDELRLGANKRLLATVGEVYGAWDPDAIRRVLTNLIGDAFAHGAPGATVHVSLAASRDGALLEVMDDGHRFDAPDPQRLFDPLQGGPSSLPTGRGLGLFFVREIARAHGGTVSWGTAAKPGGGTAFVVSVALPFVASGTQSRAAAWGPTSFP